MKISILTPDFSNNCLGRAWLLAKLLQNHFSVEVIGPAFGRNIWKPLRNACDFQTKIVKGNPGGRFEFKKMLNSISGDMIYATKPLMASFGVGLVKKIRTRKPLVLDIDDWELGFGKEFYDSLIWPKKINDFFLSKSNWRSYYYTVIMDKLIWLANDLTVSGKILQAKYGGTIIWHGRDVSAFNQKKYDKAELRRKHLQHEDRELTIIGFIGTPRPHKGLEDLLDAVSLLDDQNVLLLILAAHEDSYSSKLRQKIEILNLRRSVSFLPEHPFEKLPELLSIIDLVIVPQRMRSSALGQVPAKIFDAMAMGKPIIATNVCDIPEILSDCGWVVQPEHPKQLAETIRYVLKHPAEAKDRGKKAREKCKSEYSLERMEENLLKVFQRYERN
jgi:glycosyltransferase involved in cell wall biosynthesis